MKTQCARIIFVFDLLWFLEMLPPVWIWYRVLKKKYFNLIFYIFLWITFFFFFFLVKPYESISVAFDLLIWGGGFIPGVGDGIGFGIINEITPLVSRKTRIYTFFENFYQWNCELNNLSTKFKKGTLVKSFSWGNCKRIVISVRLDISYQILVLVLYLFLQII